MRSVVFVCADEPRILTESSDVQAVGGLCKDPNQLADHVGEVERAVLLLHRDGYDVPLVQAALRRAGIDPFGAQIHDVASGAGPVPSRQTAALRRRSEQFVGSGPKHAKPVLPSGVTRRGFLRPPTAESVAAPAIDPATCAADDGCRACVTVCPQGAYRWEAGQVSYDKSACIPCGRCVTTCPTGAIENPAITPAMLDAQVRQLLGNADGSLGIRFVCSRGSIDPEEAWADVVVPCAAMVPASWLVACRLLGAGCAKAVPCSAVGCPLDLDVVQVRQNELASAIMAEAGLDGATIIFATNVDPEVNLFETGMAAEVVTRVAAMAERDFLVLDDAAELGIVAIEPSTCTLCGRCAKVCPTNALRESHEGNLASITFQPSLCANCTQCMSECPELSRSAIAVTGCIDTHALRGGRETLNHGEITACEKCGAAIASGSMMTRITELLGDEFHATIDVLTNRCIDCRGR